MKAQFYLLYPVLFILLLLYLLNKPYIKSHNDSLSDISSVSIINYKFEPNKNCSIFHCPYSYNLLLTSSIGSLYSLPLSQSHDLYFDIKIYDSLLKDQSLILKTYKHEGFLCAYGLYGNDMLVLFDYSNVYNNFVQMNYSKSLYDYSLFLNDIGSLFFKPYVSNACYKYRVHLNPNQAY